MIEGEFPNLVKILLKLHHLKVTIPKSPNDH